MIVFRVNGSYGSGVGHIKRAIKLAESIKNQYKILFIIDSIKDLPSTFIPPWLDIADIYSQGESYRNEEEDANLCIKALQGNSKVSAVVVDDYRFSEVWEKKIKIKLTPNLIVFDDGGEVKHSCSVLIDSRYSGNEIASRYEGKTNPDCIKLLGPKYFFAPKNVSKNGQNNQHSKVILITLGGGGDLEIMAPVVRHLLEELDYTQLEKIYLVEGPFSRNVDRIRGIVVDERLKIIKNSTDLTEYLTEASVYIGSSGTTLFEALSVGCNCLSFSLSENQINNKKNLEAFGHYFHINNINDIYGNDFAVLCKNLYLKRARIKELQKNAIIKLDGRGVERVRNILTEIIDRAHKNNFLFKNIEDQTMRNLSGEDDIKNIREIQDRDVNAYLAARNIKKNAENMTVTSSIGEVEHYNWWLTNERESYVMEKGENPIMYIWHQVIRIKTTPYLIGGWFVADQKTSPLDVMSALKYQLDVTKEKYPAIIWLAIIKKTNKFVKKLNEKYGFKAVVDKKYEDAIEEIFPNVDKIFFDYYYK